ncbi:hypothetical protein HMPREF9243_0360 [Aerococcus sp. Group 1]|nr:hypothetical protein HMPREF9243_0360 [Aerococcus sp. Group 1]
MSTYSYPDRMSKAILIKISCFPDPHNNLLVKKSSWISGEWDAR